SPRPGRPTGAASIRTEAAGNGLLPGAGRARAGLHRVPRLRGGPGAPVQLGGPAKVPLRVAAPVERQESAAQILVGAGIAWIEPDRVLEMLQGLRRLAVLVENGAEVGQPLRPPGRDRDGPVEDLRRFLV